MKLWHKALIAAVVSEGIAFLMWTIGIRIVAGEPHITLIGYMGAYLHYPGFPVEAWAHSHGHGDTMIPVIGVPLLCWLLLWTGTLWSITKMKRSSEQSHRP
jgi:hypothetical protein